MYATPGPRSVTSILSFLSHDLAHQLLHSFTKNLLWLDAMLLALQDTHEGGFVGNYSLRGGRAVMVLGRAAVESESGRVMPVT